MSGFCRSGGGSSGSSSGSKCGRWSPTAEQVKLLTHLFTSGLRTPTTDQIQKISAHLSFYGHIESKNVFYWFQNHKARERHSHKRRKLSFPPHKSSPSNNNGNPERTIETLQLFPLESLGQSEADKLTPAHGNCRDQQMEPPPLDLRLSFL